MPVFLLLSNVRIAATEESVYHYGFSAYNIPAVTGLDRAQLDRAAHEDVLTGLNNRRHAEFALPLLVEGARVSGQVISVAALDVDHFKQINDGHGHAIGDALPTVIRTFVGDSARYIGLVRV